MPPRTATAGLVATAIEGLAMATVGVETATAVWEHTCLVVVIYNSEYDDYILGPVWWWFEGSDGTWAQPPQRFRTPFGKLVRKPV